MGNTSTSHQALEEALAQIPISFRARLIGTYDSLKAAFVNRDFDTCGLRGGKFAETLLRYLQESLTGAHIPFGTKIQNFSDECINLERLPKSAGVESLRILMPRALVFIYTIRNKRDIGHVGGDVEANEIDAATIVRTADWCLSELVRITHSLSLEEAQAILDAIAERQFPAVWSVAGRKRVLDATLTQSEQTLVLLYSDADTAVPVEDLAAWVEVGRVDNYRGRVLASLHSQRLIELDSDTDCVILSPKGSVEAERILSRH